MCHYNFEQPIFESSATRKSREYPREWLIVACLEGATSVVPGGARQGHGQGELGPALLQVGAPHTALEDPHHVPQEGLDLLGALDEEDLGRDLLAAPQGAAFPAGLERGTRGAEVTTGVRTLDPGMGSHKT